MPMCWRRLIYRTLYTALAGMQYKRLDMHVPTMEVDSIGLYTAYGERQPILLQRQKSTANFLSEIRRRHRSVEVF